MTEKPHEKPTLWQVIGSVQAAFFGVQSEKNRERDFTHGNARQYITVGLIATILFVLFLWAVVKLVMYLSGA